MEDNKQPTSQPQQVSVEKAAKQSYEDNKPVSAFGMFSIKEQNNRQLYKEGYENGWKAHEQQQNIE